MSGPGESGEPPTKSPKEERGRRNTGRKREGATGLLTGFAGVEVIGVALTTAVVERRTAALVLIEIPTRLTLAARAFRPR